MPSSGNTSETLVYTQLLDSLIPLVLVVGHRRVETLQRSLQRRLLMASSSSLFRWHFIPCNLFLGLPVSYNPNGNWIKRKRYLTTDNAGKVTSYNSSLFLYSLPCHCHVICNISSSFHSFLCFYLFHWSTVYLVEHDPFKLHSLHNAIHSTQHVIFQ